IPIVAVFPFVDPISVPPAGIVNFSLLAHIGYVPLGGDLPSSIQTLGEIRAIDSTGTVTFLSQPIKLGTISLPPVWVFPGSLAFGKQPVGTTSSVGNVSMRNNQNGTSAISGVTVTGKNAADFTATSNCG